MATTLYRDTGYALHHLIAEIEHGNIALPDIQRPFVWTSSKIRDLFDSMYRGYPVGTLMFWETGADVGTRQVGRAEAPGRVAKLLIVDGQQRLTSLYAVLTGVEVLTKSFEHKRIRIAFSPRTQRFEVTDAAIERDPAFVPDITSLWNSGYKSTVREYLARLSSNSDEPLSHDEQDRLEERLDRVRDLRDFRFQVIELSAAADEEQVADIFVRINSEGVQLNQADFILTLMSVHWEEGRRALEAFCRASVDAAHLGASPRNAFIDPSPDQLLRASVGLAFKRGRLYHVYNVLRGKDLVTGETSAQRREEQFALLEAAQADVLDLTNWHEFLKCLTHAGFRSKRMITSQNAILFSYVLWLVGKRDFGVTGQPLRDVIARWFFMAHTTGRYTSSPESAIEADLGRLEGLTPGDGQAFVSTLDTIIRANFTSDYWTISLPNRLDTAAGSSPVLYAYWAALNLLDAELLLSQMRVRDLLDPSVTAPRSIERHHLFPKAYLAKQGVTGTRAVNAIANMAFIDWPENASVGAQPPSDYWPEMSARLGESRLRNQRHWHALPVGWEQLDYEEFKEKRRGLIAGVIKEGFEQLWSADAGGALGHVGVDDVIRAGESQTVEFKSSARWNVRAGQVDRKMEHVILKTVCGFLNGEGGTLLIGVEDSGEVRGLVEDLASLSKPDRDGYELFLRQLLDNGLSVRTVGTVRIDFADVGGFDVCRVTVAASGRPVFSRAVDGRDRSEFWVRNGNATVQLHGDEMVLYQQDHWG